MIPSLILFIDCHHGIYPLRHSPCASRLLAALRWKEFAATARASRNQNANSHLSATGQGSSLPVRRESSHWTLNASWWSCYLSWCYADVNRLFRAASMPSSSPSSSEPLRTSSVSASGSRSRATLWSPLPTRRARTPSSRRSSLTLRSSLPLRTLLPCSRCAHLC